MNTVKDLIRSSVELLRNRSLTNASYSKPHYPVCVVYLGLRSALFHDELMTDLARGWGGNIDFMCFYTLENPGSTQLCPLASGKGDRGTEAVPLATETLQGQLTAMMSAQEAFADMSRIALYGVLDTTGLQAASDLREWYGALERIKEMMATPTLSMLMVVLNESLQHAVAAKEMKQELLALYRENNTGTKGHRHEAVLVLGNKLRNGAYINLDPTAGYYVNYNLFADIILLSNTRGSDYGERRACIYGNNRPGMTAAYGFVQKPMEEIAMVALDAVLEKLKERLDDRPVDSEGLMGMLDIERGRSKLYESFYERIKGLLPTNEFLEWMPGRLGKEATFAECDCMSDGCLQAFLDQNHFAELDAALRDLEESIAKELDAGLCQGAQAARLKNGVNRTTRDEAYGKAELAFAAPERLQVFAGIEAKSRQHVVRFLRTKTDEAIDEAVRKAQQTLSEFQDVCMEQQRMSAIGEGEMLRNLSEFYGTKAQRSYSDENKSGRLLEQVLRPGNSRM
ncbi:MAG: hypothetical protein LBG81_00535, partial [Coriobacteriaceae bacterium]|nr:hypothetical protein [Coriobacteriaceae bacterium]